MSEGLRYERLAFEREPGRIAPYAHLYSWGEAGAPAPLILYVGGSISRQVYAQRRNTEPTPIREALASALRVRAGRPPTGQALVCPCPVDTDGAGIDWIVEHLDQDLVPALAAPPSALACLGYSAGAAYAAHAAAIAEARALAVFGSSGLLRTLRDDSAIMAQREPDGLPPLRISCFRNAEDPVQSQAELQQVEREFGARVMAPRPGGHGAASYLKNGTVASCFGILLDELG